MYYWMGERGSAQDDGGGRGLYDIGRACWKARFEDKTQ